MLEERRVKTVEKMCKLKRGYFLGIIELLRSIYSQYLSIFAKFRQFRLTLYVSITIIWIAACYF